MSLCRLRKPKEDVVYLSENPDVKEEAPRLVASTQEFTPAGDPRLVIERAFVCMPPAHINKKHIGARPLSRKSG